MKPKGCLWTENYKMLVNRYPNETQTGYVNKYLVRSKYIELRMKYRIMCELICEPFFVWISEADC